ncbi:MAG: arylsulfatase [Verrucomicrobia bacterium]|nr:arylsulfatase [Verrucomicrobiota bacterium]MBV8484056.1 arylsulfatase [Verrucomicrobiota bacterium]
MQSHLEILKLLRSSCVPSFAVWLHVLLSGTLASGSPEKNATATSPGSPNLVLIVADDMGFSDTSPYGGEIFTPNIASLAYQGTMFINFHVAPTCTPTRAMLLTGRDNHDVGVGNMKELLADNQYGKPGYEGGLNSQAVTIATILRGAGYHTYMAGKWHLGQTKEQLPASQGFEDSVVLGEGGADNWEKKPYTPKYKAVHFYEGLREIDLPTDFYSSKFYTDKLLGYIDKNVSDGRPFFGYLAFQAVHQPHQAPAEFTERYTWTYRAGWSAIKEIRYQRQVELGIMPPGLELLSIPGIPDWSSLSPDEQRMSAKRMAVYAGMLEYMDMSIGRVLAYLKDKNLLDNTVIVFMSDNGGEATELLDSFPDYYRKNFDLTYERLGEKGTYSEYGPGWANVAMTPFSGFKIMTSEGGTRAPLVIRYPKKVAEGQRTDAFVSVLDIVPTLLDFAGVQAKNSGTLAGHTMTPLLGGSSKKVHEGTELFVAEIAGNVALYRGDYKLERNLPPFGDKQWHLYNLRLDPTEAHDLASTDSDLVKSLTGTYGDYIKQHNLVEVPDGYSVIEQAKKNMARGDH